jgi:hypothetical protein
MHPNPDNFAWVFLPGQILQALFKALEKFIIRG